MQLPLEIATATGITLPPEMEAEIREKADGLHKFCKDIVRCRVSIEAPAHHHRQPDFTVHVTIAVPGEELVVDHHTHKDHHAHSDLHTAVRDSFLAARRQLEDYAQRHQASNR